MSSLYTKVFHIYASHLKSKTICIVFEKAMNICFHNLCTYWHMVKNNIGLLLKMKGFFKTYMRHFIEKTVSIMEFSVLEGWGLCNLHKGMGEICLLEILSCHYIVFLSSIVLISRRFKERKHIRPHLSLTCSYKRKRVKITTGRFKEKSTLLLLLRSALLFCI